VLLEAQQPFLIARFHQFVHQRRRGRKPYPQSPLARCQAERQCDVRLPGPGIAQTQHVLPSSNPLTPRQFQYQLFVQRRDCQIIKRLQALHHRKLGRLDPPLRRLAFPFQHLGFHQPQRKSLEIHSLLGALLGQFGVLAQHGGQFQLLQVVLQQDLGCIHHRPPAGISAWESAARVSATCATGR
jgi:hypothetical protein